MSEESGWRPRVGDRVRREADGDRGPVNTIVQLTFDGRYGLVEVESSGVFVQCWIPVKAMRRVTFVERCGRVTAN